MGIPVPGEAALVGAALLAHRGDLDITVVIAVAAAAAIAGDNVGYVVGRKGGRKLLERPGPLLEHRRRVLQRGEPFFDRHGASAVFLGRWVALLRIAAAWLAGINRMPWPAFAAWNAAGGVAWAASVGLGAYLAGPVVEQVVRAVGLGAVALVLLLGGGILLLHRRRGRGDDARRADDAGRAGARP